MVVEVVVKLRPTVSRSVYLDVGPLHPTILYSKAESVP
jgi:hypothetical protein